ncbi:MULTISPECIES: hypothetical protein [unclassified Streptomyces]|uniref:hypothetical protein n=1 Tax=unclassified Streptomyces TaxID=2593676 RepID=UPI003322EBB5
MIHQLQVRVSGLTPERDQLAQAHAPSALETSQRKLSRAKVQKGKADEELRRAEAKRRQAEELADVLQKKNAELTDDLDRLKGGPPPP